MDAYDVSVPQSNVDIASVLANAARILREEGASEVYVFGSFARGSVGPDSDLDLAVAGLPEGRILIAMNRLLAELGRLSDLVQAEREPEFMTYLRSTGAIRRVA